MLDRRRLLIGGVSTGTAGLLRQHRAFSQPVSRILFQQPVAAATIDKTFSVTRGTPPYNPVGVWYMHANQPNPFRGDRNFVPVNWDAGTMTGYQVAGDRNGYQRGIADASGTSAGHTCAQMQGGVVGAYLNSADLIRNSLGYKMMVSPLYTYPTSPAIIPFSNDSSLVSVSLDLQVPVASDAHIAHVNSTYVSLILLLSDRVRGTRVAFQCNAFTRASTPQKDGSNYDAVTKSLIVGAFIADFAHYLTPTPGSALFQSAPWRGWKTFSFTISAAQFAMGVRDAAVAHSARGVSLRPADYVLSQLHLNAEMVYRPTLPTRMGWSMRNLLVRSNG